MDGEEESNDKEHKVKDVVDPLKTLSFRERMKKLSPHCLPLKERVKDQLISNVDLLRLDPYPARSDKDLVPRESRRLAVRKK